MADIKISAMPAASLPLTGAELVPIVQGGANDKATVADFGTQGAFKMLSSAIITETTASRTLSAGDNGKVIYCTLGTTVTITTAVGLGAGFSCLVIQGGLGQVLFAAASSTTVLSYGNTTKTAGQYAIVTVICPAADSFYLGGSMV